MPSPTSARTRSPAIDLTRALSIVWIVGFWHVLDYVPELYGTKNPVTYHTTVALLGLFVLISGYLMGLRDIPLNGTSLLDFYMRRFGRIYPPFLIACLAFAVVKMAPLATMVKAALLVAMLWGPPPTTLWFITMIVLFYAITPLLTAIRARTWVYAPVIVIVTAALIAAQACLDGVNPRLAIYFPAYAAGVWLAQDRVRAAVVARIGLALVPIGLLLSIGIPTAEIENSVWSTTWALAAPLAIFGTAMTLDRRIAPTWWVSALAEASFFLYLFHRIVYGLGLKLVNPSDPTSRLLLVTLVFFPLALIVSLLGQRWYDSRWQQLMSRTGRPAA